MNVILSKERFKGVTKFARMQAKVTTVALKYYKSNNKESIQSKLPPAAWLFEYYSPNNNCLVLISLCTDLLVQYIFNFVDASKFYKEV